MSAVRKFNENPVTALSDTDYIVACDASGALSPITKADFLKQAGEGCAMHGRNLVSQLNIESTMDKTADGLRGKADRDSYFKLTAAVDMRPYIGKWLTFSMDVSGLGASTTWEFSVNNKDTYTKALTNGRFFIPFIGDASTCLEKGGTILIDDRTRNLAGMNPTDLHLSNFMIERGKVAHAFSVAPEDILERLTALENLARRWGG